MFIYPGTVEYSGEVKGLMTSQPKQRVRAWLLYGLDKAGVVGPIFHWVAVLALVVSVLPFVIGTPHALNTSSSNIVPMESEILHIIGSPKVEIAAAAVFVLALLGIGAEALGGHINTVDQTTVKAPPSRDRPS